nr:anthrone oxygenase family protein [Kibdelosporangium sp. MJ126-NF4]CEL17245.1 integral-membrane protein [Kibdelosporangium sp. MJ126-NF4]CTQ91525.1 integral-membrane protein [Kibdelosporangium sp. MJ126-NF4]
MLAQQGAGQQAQPRSKAAAPLLYLATLTVGLMAGFFFAFAILVMPSLGKVDDRAFVVTMQKINEGVQNGAFMFAFLGAFVFTGAAAIVHHRAGYRAAARWIIAAMLLYVVALALTIGGNVPLNDKLAGAGDPAVIADFAAARAAFDEGAWNALNAARTIACMLSLLALVPAIALHGRATKALKTGSS